MYAVSEGRRPETCFSRMPAVWMITTAYTLALIRLRKRGNISWLLFLLSGNLIAISF